MREVRPPVTCIPTSSLVNVFLNDSEDIVDNQEAVARFLDRLADATSNRSGEGRDNVLPCKGCGTSSALRRAALILRNLACVAILALGTAVVLEGGTDAEARDCPGYELIDVMP
jgi:hypothetical protein